MSRAKSFFSAAPFVCFALCVAACSTGGGALPVPDLGAATPANLRGTVDGPRDDGAVNPSTPDASAATLQYVVPFDAAATFDKGFRFHVSVGGGPAHVVVMDTGSTGVVVPKSALGPDAVMTTDVFRIEYISSGVILTGHWAVAAIRIGVPAAYDPSATGGPAYATTVPMRIGVVEAITCDPNIAGCTTTGNVDAVGMMGVGFDRGLPTFTSAHNAFLQVAEISAGTMHPGYAITATQVTIGLTPSTVAGFQTAQLAPLAGNLGEWDATSVKACVMLPALPAFGSPCGALLVDTGIAGAILTTPTAMRPKALATVDPARLDTGTQVSVAIFSGKPAFTYAFTVGAMGDGNPGYALLRTSTDGEIHINTSRHLLATHDYLFDAASGLVGVR